MKRFVSILLAFLMVIPFGAFSATTLLAEAAEEQNLKTVYLSDGGSGDGMTPEAPLGSMLDAYNALGADGGNIVIVGTYTQSANFFGPKHTGKLVIKGVDENAVYSISKGCRYFLGGPTEFTDIAITAIESATWMTVCLFNDFTITDTVTVTRTGSFVIVGGGQGDNTVNGCDYTVKDCTLTINGGDWEYIYGSVRTSLLVPGGKKSANDFRNYELTMNVGGNAKIKKLYMFSAGESACNMIANNSKCTVNLNGGQVTYFMSSHSFKTVTAGYSNGVTVNIGKDFDLSKSFNDDATVTADNRVNSASTYCGLSAESGWGDNVLSIKDPPLNDTLIIADEIYESVINDKKLRLSQFENVLKASEVQEEDEVVIGDGIKNGMIYVKQGSNGTGASAENAIGDFYTAIEYAATLENDATVIVCGEVDFDASASYHEKPHTNTITWKSLDSSSYLKIKNAASQAYYMNGKLTLDSVTLKMTTTSTFQFITQYHDFKAEENVAFMNTNGSSHYVTLRANISTTSIGYDEKTGLINKDAYISLKSGTYENVCYYNSKGIAPSSGTFTCYVGGIAQIKNLIPNRGGTIALTNANITLDGGSILRFVAAADQLVDLFDQNEKVSISGTFNLTITKKFDVKKSFSLATASTTTFFGISGVTCALVGDRDLRDRAEYNLTIDSEVFWAVKEWVQENTFDTITVNGDIPQEPVTNAYITRMVRYLSGWTVDYFIADDADKNEDGKLNNRDIIYCIQELAGWYDYILSRTINIACVGDSITYGVGASDAKTKSYPAQLQEMLGNHYNVQNFGRPSAYMINPVDYPDYKYAAARSVAYTSTTEYQNSLASNPDIVFICLGANDAHISNINAEVDQARYYYESAVKLAKSYKMLESKPTVYFVYPPARYDAQYRIDYIKNTIIPLLDNAAKECGCEVIDLFSRTEKFAQNKDVYYITTDGIHLADAGYTVMAEVMYEKAVEYRLAD